MIIGQSGRMLAQSAFKVGIPTVVIDLFGDQDTRFYAEEIKTIADFSSKTLLKIIEVYWNKYDFLGLVPGSGFEHQPELINSLNEKYTILGNDHKTVTQAKDPVYFSELLKQLEILHPKSQFETPEQGEWLVKQPGACGGDHIARWDKDKSYPETYYYQEYQQGMSCSAVFLSDGQQVEIVGVNQIWVESETSFRFGGAVTFSEFPVLHSLQDIVEKLSHCLNLIGMCGLDFILDECDQIHVLEINPRPVATFDLHESKADSLFLSHIRACEGNIDFKPAIDQNYYAKSIIYTNNKIERPDRDWPEQWPDWTSDIPNKDECIEQGDPLCTVYAEASTADKAIKLVHNRYQEIVINHR